VLGLVEKTRLHALVRQIDDASLRASARFAAMGSPLQLRAALQMTLMFQAVLLAIAIVRAYFGSRALVATSAFVGMTDLDALTISLARGSSGDHIATGPTVVALAAGIISNTVVKLALALVVGKGRFRVVTVTTLAALATLLIASVWLQQS
jgi:uncharacterized membrane protein (DUF4010 family)